MTDRDPVRFTLDATYRRYDRVVLGGSPLRLFRLSAGGARLMEAIENGDDLPAAHTALTERLVDAGVLHRQTATGRHRADDVTIVVPAFNALPSSTITHHRLVVVDDGSTPELAVPSAGRCVRLPSNRGPAAARNAGLAAVETSLVAFVDTDVDVEPGWFDPLLAHFDDDAVALVAPRVRSAPGSGVLARYDEARSPLDLGATPGRIAAGTRISYVPAAAIVARTDALRAIGGFDESMRVGEDVDLVWRLVEAGQRCRYEPAATVRHRPRTTLARWLRQRLAYGRSAAALDCRHPGAVAPLRISGWTAAVWGLVAMRRPLSAFVVAAGTIVALRRKLADVPAAEAARLAGLGHLYAGRQIASAITRTWWPIAAIVAIVSNRLRPALLAAVAAPPLIDWARQRPGLGPAEYVALRVADDVAYGAGVWAGAVSERRLGPLRPEIRNWPGRGAG